MKLSVLPRHDGAIKECVGVRRFELNPSLTAATDGDDGRFFGQRQTTLGVDVVGVGQGLEKDKYCTRPC